MCDCQKKQSFDAFEMDSSSKRVLLADGSLLIRDCKIARSGVQHYSGRELGIGRDGMVGVFRPEEEVFDAESMASFEGAPITLEHPSTFVTDSNKADLQIGFAANVRRSGDFLIADLTITDKAIVARMMEKDAQGRYTFAHGEISNGYAHGLEVKDGVYRGQSYVAVQRDIRGNHVALVRSARCGAACKVSDSSEQPRKEKTLMSTDSNPGLRAFAFDGQTVMVNDAAALIIDRLSKDKADLETRLKAATDAGEASAKVIAEMTTAADALKAGQVNDEMIADIVVAIDQSRQIAADLKIEGKTAADIRRAAIGKAADSRKAVIDAALAGTELDKASPEQLKIIAGVLAADTATKGTSPVNKTGDGTGGFKMQQVETGARPMTADGKPRLTAQQQWAARNGQ